MMSFVQQSTDRDRCHECDKSPVKIHREYRGHRYCGICYAREFKRRLCGGCGNYTRLLRSDPDALCRSCECNQPCCRCGKQHFATAKLTPFGPVCPVCAPKFRRKTPCDFCLTPTATITRTDEGETLCRRCAQQSFRTCHHCRRYRDCETDAHDKPICTVCKTSGTKTCPVCDNPMPSGYGNRCETCYWHHTATKRVEMYSQSLTTDYYRQLYRAFGRWLIKEKGPKAAALSLFKHASFFLILETPWATLPSYADLLNHLGAESLRRAKTPMAWLETTGQLVVDSVEKEANSERRRIASLIDKLPKQTISRDICDRYVAVLEQRLATKRITLRTLRLNLYPAVELLKRSMPGLPNQRTLNRFIAKSPGQRAALYGFVKFLSQHHDLALQMPAKHSTAARNNREKALEIEIAKLANAELSPADREREWIMLALCYFHGMNRTNSRRACQPNNINTLGTGFTVNIGEDSLYVPPIPKGIIPIRGGGAI